MKINTPEPLPTIATSRGQTYPRSAPIHPDARGLHLKNILVPLDFSERSMRALDYAEPMAKLFGATITLLHVVEPPVYPVEMISQGLMEQETQSVATRSIERIRDTRMDPDVAAEAIVRHGFVFDTIIEVVREKQIDLIITTTRGCTGLQHMLSSSVAECVLRHAPCPVLVVRECEHEMA